MLVCIPDSRFLMRLSRSESFGRNTKVGFRENRSDVFLSMLGSAVMLKVVLLLAELGPLLLQYFDL